MEAQISKCNNQLFKNITFQILIFLINEATLKYLQRKLFYTVIKMFSGLLSYCNTL